MPQDVIKSGAIQVDLRDLNRLYTSLGKMADTGARDEFQASLRQAGESVAVQARALSGWSKRIPASIRVSQNKARVQIRAGGVGEGKKHRGEAKAFEHNGKPGSFRHPVYGNRDKWVDQNARPFLVPALIANAERAKIMIEAAISRVLARAGF